MKPKVFKSLLKQRNLNPPTSKRVKVPNPIRFSLLIEKIIIIISKKSAH